MKELILSSTIKFSTEDDVKHYNAITPTALPRTDIVITEATKIVVGYQHIIVFGATGRRMAVLSRKDFTGMAIDGKPVTISGKSFHPFTVDQTAVEADADTGDTADEEKDVSEE